MPLSRTFNYDAAGNLVRRVDRNGRVRAFDYDQDGRLVREIWYNTVADADLDRDRENTITWTYDESGKLLSVVDDFSSYSYAYDSSGRVTTEIVSNAGGPVTVITTEYGTRLDNQPVSRSATVNGTPDFVNLYEYDAQDRLVALRQTGQGSNAVADKLVTFTYNENSQFVTITRYASLDGTHVVAVSDYTYDQLGRPVSLVHYQDAADPLAAYTWTWEGGGNAVEVVPVGATSGPQFGTGWMFSFSSPFAPVASREVEVNPLPDHVWTFDTALLGRLVQATSTDGTADYQYDPRGQLIGADYTAGVGLPTVPPDEFYAYDPNGNRTNPGYVTGDHNRLISDGTYQYEYDAEGNRTRRTEIATGEITEYTWDHRNRLVRVTTRTTDNGPLTTDTWYAYDTQNRWIARSHDPDGDGPQDFTNTYFVCDGTPPTGSMLDLAAMTKENIGQIVLHFESDASGDLQLAHRYLWGPAVDQILADEQITDPNAPGNILWPLTDHLNTVRDLAAYDATTGITTIVNHQIYDAYGRLVAQTDPDQTTLFAFTARPLDEATGLQNNLHRWYDPQTGRWLSEDPIGFQAGDSNLYRYVDNNTVIHVDPSGLEWVPGREEGGRNRFYHGEWYHWVDPTPPTAPPMCPKPKVYICEREAQVIGGGLANKLLGKKHQWIVIVYPDGAMYCAGMGNAHGVPGQGGQTSPDCPCTPTAVRDHSGEPMGNCRIVPQADADRLRRQMEIGAPTGHWIPGVNDCNTWVKENIENSCPRTRPPAWTDLPAAISPEYRQELYRQWFDPDCQPLP